MIKKFEQPIYPFELYIAIDDNLENILNEFVEANGECSKHYTNSAWSNQHDGQMYYDLRHKDSIYQAYLLAFPRVPDLKTVVHEAYHVIHRLYEYIGEDKFGNEATAYLLEWIFQCGLTTIKEFENDTSLENSKL